MCKSSAKAVLIAFMGPPIIEDPFPVWLQETGWTMAKEVFHPPNSWPTKDANTFMVKNLTLVIDQNKE